MKRTRWPAAAGTVLLVGTWSTPLLALDINVPFFKFAFGEKKAEEKQPPRFADNQDGTVTDRRTGLIWLKDANCTAFFSGDSQGLNSRSWKRAVNSTEQLASGFCGLADSSTPGDWRLPAKEELLSLVNRAYEGPALGNAAGTGQWTEGDPFVGVQSFFYWSSAADKNQPDYAFYVNMAYGVDSYAFQLNTFHVWPVRNAK